MDAMISTVALAGLEKLINTALRYDPGTRIAIAALQEQVLAITVTAPEFTIYVTPDEDGLCLMGHWEGEVHTQLRGSLPALMQLARNERTSFADSGVEVIGNTGLLVDLQRLLKHVDIDWEEALSQLLGDVVGHQSAEFVRSGVSYARDRASELRRLLGEFLTEEFKTVPAKSELDEFYQDVDELRLQADRLDARVREFLKQRR